MKTVAIIQARTSSSRLPGKVLKPLGHMDVIGWIVRAALNIIGVDKVVVATSDQRDDDKVAAWCNKNDISCYRGSLNNVLERFIEAAKYYEADIIMRLTADCPFLDPHVCGEVIKLRKTTNADYATNALTHSWPHGLDCEVMTREALEISWKEARDPYQLEHVTPFIYQNKNRFIIHNLLCPTPELDNQRWTLDYPEDFEFMQKVVAHLPNNHPPSYQEILNILDKNPDIKNNCEHRR